MVKQLLRELASQGRTILFCSHILDVVERICTRIVIIDQGRKVAEGSPEGIARETGTANLEAAFARLTGVRDAGEVTRGLLSALEDGPEPPRTPAAPTPTPAPPPADPAPTSIPTAADDES